MTTICRATVLKQSEKAIKIEGYGNTWLPKSQIKFIKAYKNTTKVLGDVQFFAKSTIESFEKKWNAEPIVEFECPAWLVKKDSTLTINEGAATTKSGKTVWELALENKEVEVLAATSFEDLTLS